MDMIDLLLVLVKTIVQASTRKLKMKLPYRGVIEISRVGIFTYYRSSFQNRRYWIICFPGTIPILHLPKVITNMIPWRC